MKISWLYNLFGTSFELPCGCSLEPGDPVVTVCSEHTDSGHTGKESQRRVACVFVFLWIITAVLYSVRCVKPDHLHERGPERTLFIKTVLWGEVVGCIVLGLYPSCQITIQLTVFPEVAVMSSDDTGSFWIWINIGKFKFTHYDDFSCSKLWWWVILPVIVTHIIFIVKVYELLVNKQVLYHKCVFWFFLY